MEATRENNIWEKLVMPKGPVRELLDQYETLFNDLPVPIKAKVITQYKSYTTPGQQRTSPTIEFNILRSNDPNSIKVLFKIELTSDRQTEGTFQTTVTAVQSKKTPLLQANHTFKDIPELEEIINLHIEQNDAWRNMINILIGIR